MLSDNQRKVLRVAAALSKARSKPPTPQEIARRAGRTIEVVNAALVALREAGYVQWDGVQLAVLREWEDVPLKRSETPHMTSVTKEWMDYEMYGE